MSDTHTPAEQDYDQNNVQIPRVARYFMSWNNHQQVEQYVRDLTSNNASQNPFIEKLLKRLSFPGRVVVAQLMSPLVPSISKRVIGEQGYWLKWTTTCTEAHFLWHDRQTNRFIVIARDAHIARRALEAIRFRIYKQMKLMESKVTEEERQILLWQRIAAWETVNTDNPTEMEHVKYAIQHLLAYTAAPDKDPDNVWFLVDGTLITV